MNTAPGVYLVDGVPYRAGRRCWTADEDACLRARYADMPTRTLAAEIGRTLSSTSGRAGAIGLKKSAAYLASGAACRVNGTQPGCRATQYKKGQPPPNKGLRRPGYSVGRGRMRETQFKKGQLSQNTYPIGGTRLVDGYVYVKVSAIRYVAWTRNWRPLHVVQWERAHGPVPPGHVVCFKDGDRANADVDNLECLSREALMARNTVHNLPAPLPQVLQLIGAVKAHITRKTRGEKQNRRSA